MAHLINKDYDLWQKGILKKQYLLKTARIEEHQQKIRLQLKKDYPDQGLIRHWQKEIKAFEKGIKQALKRLGKK